MQNGVCVVSDNQKVAGPWLTECRRPPLGTEGVLQCVRHSNDSVNQKKRLRLQIAQIPAIKARGEKWASPRDLEDNRNSLRRFSTGRPQTRTVCKPSTTTLPRSESSNVRSW